MTAWVKAGFAHRSQSAGGYGEAARSAGGVGGGAGAECMANPLGVPISTSRRN
jgi:hypothetical protein